VKKRRHQIFNTSLEGSIKQVEAIRNVLDHLFDSIIFQRDHNTLKSKKQYTLIYENSIQKNFKVFRMGRV